MRGLTIVVAEAATGRAHAALSLAAAQAAMGGRARVFFHADAVALLRPPVTAPEDAHHTAAGLPTLAALIDEALALGVELTACQTGLALSGTSAAGLDGRIGFAGMVGVLADLGDDRLVFA
jgi:predicted peroxiredoxin